MQPCSFKWSHIGISESTCSGCSPLPAPMLPIQTDRKCLPDSANNDVHQDRTSDSSQRMWLSSCCQASMLSITLTPQQPSSSIARIPGSFIWLTIGYQGPHCLVISPWLFQIYYNIISYSIPVGPVVIQHYTLKKFLGMFVKMQILGILNQWFKGRVQVSSPPPVLMQIVWGEHFEEQSLP